jgi:hypothetical protein
MALTNEMTEALLIVDVQNDFLPSGALAVPDGDQVIDRINALAADPRFAVVIATRDWHPPDHDSFQPQGGPWPEHSVRDTCGGSKPRARRRRSPSSPPPALSSPDRRRPAARGARQPPAQRSP